MRKDGILPRGDWWNIQARKGSDPTKVYIYDEIGFWGTSAKDFVKELDALDVNDFHLHINSPGGEIFDGFTIYNAIKQHKAKVTVYVDGLAASAASFIAQAGDEVIMARHAEMMIHDGIGFAFGNEADMRKTADVLGGLSNTIADIYAQRAGHSPAYWRDLMREELWMNGTEAVDFGLADKVLNSEDGDTEEAAKEKNKWDLSLVCNVVNREQAEDPTRVAARVVMLSNQKEKNMGDEPNKEGLPTETGTPTGDPAEPGVEAVPDDTPVVEPDVEPVTADQPAATPPEPPAAQMTGVLINGRLETDMSKVAAYVQVLETAQNDAAQVARKNFVEQLSDDKKIPATQIDSLTAHALSLTDEQYATFRASYESLPASSLFDNHATTEDKNRSTPSGDRNAMTADERKDRMSILRGVVAQLTRTLSSQADVEKTNAYIELQQLEAETKE